MNAIEFVKEFGVESAVKIIRSAPASATSYRVSKNSKLGLVGAYGRVNNANCYVTSLCDLKQIVQAFELVERHGGIDSLDDLFYVHGIGSARVMAVGGLTYADAMKAINLVEKCSASD